MNQEMNINKNLKKYLLSKSNFLIRKKDISNYVYNIFYMDSYNMVGRNKYMFLYDCLHNHLIEANHANQMLKEYYQKLTYGFKYKLNKYYDRTYFTPTYTLITFDFNHHNYCIVSSLTPNYINHPFHTIDQDANYLYKQFGSAADTKKRIIFNDGIIKVRSYNKNSFYDLPLSKDLDFTPGNQILNDFKDFRLVFETRNEISKSTWDNLLIKRFSYSDFSNYTTRNDFILNKWKSLRQMKHINFNRLMLDEIIMFRYLKFKVTDSEFRKVYNWYVGSLNANRELLSKLRFWNHITIKQIWQSLYVGYIASKTISDNNVNLLVRNKDDITLLKDYINLYIQVYPRKKLEIPYRSLKRISHEEIILADQLRVIKWIDENKKYNIPFYQLKKWDKLKNNIKGLKEFKLLDTPDKLRLEGTIQHNCVATYIDKAAQNTSLLLEYKIPTQRCTVEIVYKDNKYSIIQIYKTYNRIAAPGTKEVIENIINKE